MTLLGLHLTVTLLSVLCLNTLLAYSAYPTLACGRINLAYVATAGVGGYTCAIAVHRYGVSPALAIVLAVAMSAAVALPLGAILGRARGTYLAIATLNLVVVFQIIVTNLDSYAGGALGILGLPKAVDLRFLAVAVAVVVALAALFSRTRRGVAVRVLRDDPLLAESLGIETSFNAAAMLVAASAIAGLQGAATVLWYGFVSPDAYSFSAVILGIAMVVLGGRSSWAGPLVGAIFFTLVPEWLQPAGYLRDVAIGGALLIVAVFAPEGIMGYAGSFTRRWRVQRSREARVRALALQGGADG